MASQVARSAEEKQLQDMVSEASGGGRVPAGAIPRAVLWVVPLLWSLFQLWIASPFPYVLGFGVVNDTRSRAVHLAFAVFLAFVAFPTTKSSPRRYIPLQDWLLAFLAAAAAAYVCVFYNEIAGRTGAPTAQDVIVAGVGTLLLLEGARRSLGLPLAVVAVFFLLYVFFGSAEFLPDVIRWKGASFEKAMSHMWLTTQGVFGVSLGVSSSFVFLFVLFGALLNQAGAGNYFIQVAFSLLGHMRGGPAKAAVISSAMTGLISGSSIANVVTTGTFTIPLMRKVGFTPEKAGAIEVSSSVNGMLTPPVMGAVAFLMMEYVGVSYVEVIKHAVVPALISYIALIYIVHLEAVKNGMEGLRRSTPLGPRKARLIRAGIVTSSFLILSGAVYYIVLGVKLLFGAHAGWFMAFLVLAGYVFLVRLSSRVPDLQGSLEGEDGKPRQLVFAEIYKTGLHYVMPVLVLVWLLMAERKSPAFSAFYTTLLMAVILISQGALKAFFRGDAGLGACLRRGFGDLIEGLVAGARSMVGIGVATAAAGIIVGTVTLTGVGQVMAEFIELLSGGNLLAMLFFVALISILLGMGLPATANYIVVSSLMAGVVVEIGAQSGLIVPLIAVHMFCFYYGIMADVTPPVGLACFAASAISGADPLKTGVTAFFYSLRTAFLPFLFIFNTDLLLIDVGPLEAVFVFSVALIAMLLLAAGTMGFFLTKSRLWESAALLLVAFILFRPGFFADWVSPPFEERPGQDVFALAEESAAGASLRVVISGVTLEGEPIRSVYLLPLGDSGLSGSERLMRGSGLGLLSEGGRIVADTVQFGSPAQKLNIVPGWEIEALLIERKRPPKQIFYIAAFALLGCVVLLQRRRSRSVSRAIA